MKILQVSNKPPYPPRDGGSIAMLSLLRALGRLGHEMTVLTMVTPKHKLTAQEITDLKKIAHLHTVDIDTSIHPVNLLKNFLFSRKPYHAVRFISAEFKNELVRVLSGNAFDVVQLEGLYLAPYIDTIRRHSEALVVMRAHNVEHEIWERIAHNEISLLKRKYFRSLAWRIRRFEINTLNRYDLLVPITTRDLEQFNRMGNARPAYVCPAGIDIEPVGADFSVVPTTVHHSLFFLGSLDWIPNQEGLFWFVDHVFPELHRRHPGITLHIAGRNASARFIEKISGPGMVFHGEVPDAYDFMQSNGILVAPYFSGGGMRIKIIEAMALGIPVVTTPLGAEGIDIIDGGNIVIAGSEKDFLEQLERLIKYPDFYLNIGRNARSFVQQQLDNQEIATALAGFYKKYLKCS